MKKITILFLVFAPFLAFAQNSPMTFHNGSFELKSFKITIENTKNGLKLFSSQGSAWINLSFSASKEQTRVIDEFGMTQLDNVSSNKDVKLADYLFTITKTVDGIKLTGVEGTAWKELSFSLRANDKISIDQLGMTNL